MLMRQDLTVHLLPAWMNLWDMVVDVSCWNCLLKEHFQKDCTLFRVTDVRWVMCNVKSLKYIVSYASQWRCKANGLHGNPQPFRENAYNICKYTRRVRVHLALLCCNLQSVLCSRGSNTSSDSITENYNQLCADSEQAKKKNLTCTITNLSYIWDITFAWRRHSVSTTHKCWFNSAFSALLHSCRRWFAKPSCPWMDTTEAFSSRNGKVSKLMLPKWLVYFTVSTLKCVSEFLAPIPAGWYDLFLYHRATCPLCHYTFSQPLTEACLVLLLAGAQDWTRYDILN